MFLLSTISISILGDSLFWRRTFSEDSGFSSSLSCSRKKEFVAKEKDMINI
jgi:hypothetical protein